MIIMYMLKQLGNKINRYLSSEKDLSLVPMTDYGRCKDLKEKL